MSNDDILCEHPGPGGQVCTLPYGHQPPNVHAFEVTLPRDLGRLMEQALVAAEQERAKYAKAHRRERIMFFLWAGMFLVYFILTLTRLAV